MELPVADPGTERGEGSLLQCPYCDSEAMHKLAQFLLPGLAAVCIDGTTGDLFRKPCDVAVDMRKEMVDYITERSETFISDALIESEANQAPENEMPEDPFEIVSIFMDDFSSSKRNIIGHVSGWLLSDNREDKIDGFGRWTGGRLLPRFSSRMWTSRQSSTVLRSMKTRSGLLITRSSVPSGLLPAQMMDAGPQSLSVVCEIMMQLARSRSFSVNRIARSAS
jgi:hypothetical protein